MRMTCARRADREADRELCIRGVENAHTVAPFSFTVTFPAPEQLLTSTAGGCTAAVGRRREIPPRLRKFQVRFARAPS